MIEIYTKNGKETFDSDHDKGYKNALKSAYQENDKPNYIEYYDNGNIEYESWYLNGKLHRKDGPADISYSIDGVKAIERWYLNGKLHREDGPASIAYSKIGKIMSKRYFLNNKEFSAKKFAKKTRNTIEESKIFESFKESYNKTNESSINYDIMYNDIHKDFKKISKLLINELKKNKSSKLSNFDFSEFNIENKEEITKFDGEIEFMFKYKNNLIPLILYSEGEAKYDVDYISGDYDTPPSTSAEFEDLTLDEFRITLNDYITGYDDILLDNKYINDAEDIMYKYIIE